MKPAMPAVQIANPAASHQPVTSLGRSTIRIVTPSSVKRSWLASSIVRSTTVIAAAIPSGTSWNVSSRTATISPAAGTTASRLAVPSRSQRTHNNKSEAFGAAFESSIRHASAHKMSETK